ncbi:hypothetical protein Tco_0971199 [Tanacetum coccineum]
MTTPITTSTTDSQMHNNFMTAGSRDHPPILAMGRYAQWQSRQPVTDESPSVPERIVVETFSNISPEKKNQLEVATMQVNVQFLQQLQPEWSRFVTIVKQTVDVDNESYDKLFDILKQYQKEVNEIRAEKIAKNANSLALVAAAQQYLNTYYQAPKPHQAYIPPSKHSSSTRSHATTRHKGKEIAKPITPPSELASEEDSDPEQAQRDKDKQKNLTLISKYFKTIHKPTNNNLRTTSNFTNKNVDTTTRYVNENQTRQHFAKECRKPKRANDYTYHKEKMLLCKQAEKGVPLQVVLLVESESDVEPFANLKLDTDENKKIQNQLKKANTSLSHELQECKSSLEECKSGLEKSNRTRDRYLGAINDKEVELKKYKFFKDRTI